MFQQLWDRACDLHLQNKKKGYLIFAGKSPDCEVAYVHYDDYVVLAEGKTPEEAVTAYISQFGVQP